VTGVQLEITADGQLVITDDGDEVALGTVDDVRAAVEEISRSTGGSSWGGGISFLFSLRDAATSSGPWRGPGITRLGLEAANAREILGDQLSAETAAFLDRLSVFAK
jgi:hypothetical protein